MITDHTLEVPQFEGDITNSQAVSSIEGEVRVLAPKARMPRREALVHAAWIVALGDESDNFTQFRAILKAVLAA
jgi:hypothetical protein